MSKHTLFRSISDEENRPVFVKLFIKRRLILYGDLRRGCRGAADRVRASCVMMEANRPHESPKSPNIPPGCTGGGLCGCPMVRSESIVDGPGAGFAARLVLSHDGMDRMLAGTLRRGIAGRVRGVPRRRPAGGYLPADLQDGPSRTDSGAARLRQCRRRGRARQHLHRVQQPAVPGRMGRGGCARAGRICGRAELG